jgi:hypothetical protein
VSAILAAIGDRVQRAVSERMEEAVKRQVTELGEATERAMRASVAKIEREFDRLEAIFTGHEKGAKHGPLEDLIRRHVATKETTRP